MIKELIDELKKGDPYTPQQIQDAIYKIKTANGNNPFNYLIGNKLIYDPVTKKVHLQRNRKK